MIVFLYLMMLVYYYMIISDGIKIIKQDRETRQIKDSLIYRYTLLSFIAGIIINSIIYIVSRGYFNFGFVFIVTIINFGLTFGLFYLTRLLVKHLWKKRLGMADVFLLSSTGAMFGVVIAIGLYLLVSMGFIITNLFKKKREKIIKEIAFAEYIIIPSIILYGLMLFGFLSYLF